MDWSQVEACLEGAVVVTGEGKSPSRETAPGAVLLVGRAGEVLFHKAFGCRSLLPEKSVAEPNTVYDIASLTKAVVTTTLIMKLVEHGKLELDARLSRILQTFGTLGKEQITARQLLAHCSGLSAHETFYKQIAKSDATDKAGILKSRGATEVIYNEIFRMRPENPAGKVTKYSDVGFILLGNLLEVMNGGKQLNRLAVEQVFAPLKLRSTGYIDLTKIRRRGVTPVTDVIAPTNNCPWRKSLICGQVQDENAWAMGGVAAHAGVFSTAQDLHLFATEMLRCYRGESGFVDRDVVRLFWQKDGAVSSSSWGLGWDTPSTEGSSSGRFLSPNSVGHLGYTGCSIWIDLERELDVILLTNRVHPSAENQLIKQLRPAVHDRVLETLGFGS